MRYDADHKERVHQRILAEAASAIRTKGPDRVGVAEVMAKLNLTHGGFYAHFASKDDLVEMSIAYMLEQNFANFLKRTAGLEPAAAMASLASAGSATARAAGNRKRSARSQLMTAGTTGDLCKSTSAR